jgi:hypothetical protein
MCIGSYPAIVPRCSELAKALIGPHSPFERAMILLHDVVQILDRSIQIAQLTIVVICALRCLTFGMKLYSTFRRTTGQKKRHAVARPYASDTENLFFHARNICSPQAREWDLPESPRRHSLRTTRNTIDAKALQRRI